MGYLCESKTYRFACYLYVTYTLWEKVHVSPVVLIVASPQQYGSDTLEVYSNHSDNEHTGHYFIHVRISNVNQYYLQMFQFFISTILEKMCWDTW